MEVEKIYDYREFCKIVPLSKDAFWRYCREGKIQTIKIGKSKYVKQSEVDRILTDGLPQE